MNNVTCPECSLEFSLDKAFMSDGRRYAVCDRCGTEFDTDEEVELGNEHIRRINEIDNTVFQVCCILAENPDLEWDISYITEIAEFIVSTLENRGYRIRYPSVIHEESRDYITEYPQF